MTTDPAAALRRLLLGRTATVPAVLPFDEVVAALGRLGETPLGVRDVELDTILGSVDRDGGFDRLFGPAGAPAGSAEVPDEPAPPVELYRVGEGHFVVDGHRRIAAARAAGRGTIRARVTEVATAVGAARGLRLADLPLRSPERSFAERVPLPQRLRVALELSRPAAYLELAEHVEAWAYRWALLRGGLPDRRTAAEAWFTGDYEPTVAALRSAGRLGTGTPAEAYLAFVAERDSLLRR